MRCLQVISESLKAHHMWATESGLSLSIRQEADATRFSSSLISPSLGVGKEHEPFSRLLSWGHTHTPPYLSAHDKSPFGRERVLHLLKLATPSQILQINGFKPITLPCSIIPLVSECHYGIDSQTGKHIFWNLRPNSNLLPRDSGIPFHLPHSPIPPLRTAAPNECHG